MKIEQNQIASVEPFGLLNGKQVNIIRLRGGLNMAAVQNDRGQEDVLAVASHQAILSYTLEQRFSNYQPMLMKSEGLTISKAESHSHFLTDDLRKSGHDIYSIQNDNSVDFYITKQNIKVACANGSIKDNCLSFSSLTVPKEYVGALSGAVSEKALSSGLKTVKVS